MNGDEPGADGSQTDDLHIDGGKSTIESVVVEYETTGAVVDDRVEGVVTVTLSHPDARNALNAMLRTELRRVLDATETNNAHVVVLIGSDEARMFVAGTDTTKFRERDMLGQCEASKQPRVYGHVDDLRQPVITHVNGHALNGDCELMQACDVRVAHEWSKLSQSEIGLGIMPGGGGTQ